MMKVIFVRTRDGNIFNGIDGQHDCAGTWVPVPTVKDEAAQIEAADEVGVLVHIRNGQYHKTYNVAGFHTERRDFTWRQLVELDLLPEDSKPAVKNSVGIRFHLRPYTWGTDLLTKIMNYNFKHVQGCKIVEL